MPAGGHEPNLATSGMSNGCCDGPCTPEIAMARGSRAPQKRKIVGISTILAARGHTDLPLSPHTPPYRPPSISPTEKNLLNFSYPLPPLHPEKLLPLKSVTV